MLEFACWTLAVGCCMFEVCVDGACLMFVTLEFVCGLMEYGRLRVEFVCWKLYVGCCTLEVGRCMLEFVCWMLEVYF